LDDFWIQVGHVTHDNQILFDIANATHFTTITEEIGITKLDEHRILVAFAEETGENDEDNIPITQLKVGIVTIEDYSVTFGHFIPVVGDPSTGPDSPKYANILYYPY
jgi:hypothetical protein